MMSPAPDDEKLVENYQIITEMLIEFQKSQEMGFNSLYCMTSAFAVAHQHLTRPTTMRSEAEMWAEIDRTPRPKGGFRLGYIAALRWALNE